MAYPLTNRMKAFKTGIFSELADLKKKKIAEGMDVIDLSIGSPDQSPPEFIMEELAKNSRDPLQYGYSLKGTIEFNYAVSEYYKNQFNVTLDPKNEVLQLSGSQDGLVHLPTVFAEKGDIVLVPDPGYTAYEAGVNLSGAELYPMPLKKENSFLPQLEEIPEQIAEKAKIMILNFPGNPVPAMANKSFFESVIEFAKKYNILIIHDLAYAELAFDGHKAMSFLEVSGAKEVGVEFNSLSKSFNMAGCRIGYLVGNSQVIEALGQLKSNLDYGVFLPIQKAATLALNKGNDFLKQNKEVYEHRRNVLVNGLNSIGWNVDLPLATMFIWAEVPEGWTSTEFTFALIEKSGVIVTPGNAFGKHGEGFVRIGLVQPEEKLLHAIEKLNKSGIFNKSRIV